LTQPLRKEGRSQRMELSGDERGASPRVLVDRLIAQGKPLALFLDIDGTILDVALTPSTVRVPPDLAGLLAEISKRLSGALAIVTGRPIAEADRLLQPFRPVAAGVHGAEIRWAADGEARPLTVGFGQELRSELKTLAEGMPGVVLEDKGGGIALHYRLAPEMHSSLLVTLEALKPRYPGQFLICQGRKVVELLPVGFSKGHALKQLAALPQFSGRVPVMLGDDIADIEAFRAAEEMGGCGLKVAGENFPATESTFLGPHEVLAWLRELKDRF
jgi:trehalose 6-phosphate phosphatase